MFSDWMLVVSVQYQISSFVDPVIVHKIFTEAGRVGIGLFHPPKKHFGQFRVILSGIS
jgi:hypothetical protein